MPVKKKYKDYETAMERLEEITARLESGEVKLEEAIDLYTEGLEIAKFCDRKLSEADEKIKLITQKDGLFEETDFESDEEEEEQP
jgi:exodeoxyribonuclease VII small subunit